LLGDCAAGVAMRRDKEVPAAELVVDDLHAALDSFAAAPLTPLPRLTNPGGYQRATLRCDEQVEVAAARRLAAGGAVPVLSKKNAACPQAPDALACQLSPFTSATNAITTFQGFFERYEQTQVSRRRMRFRGRPPTGCAAALPWPFRKECHASEEPLGLVRPPPHRCGHRSLAGLRPTVGYCRVAQRLLRPDP
jgi:hypothetical protein